MTQTPLFQLKPRWRAHHPRWAKAHIRKSGGLYVYSEATYSTGFRNGIRNAKANRYCAHMNKENPECPQEWKVSRYGV